MERNLNPQLIIDELARRLQQVTLENIVLTARLLEATNNIEEETTVIGDDAGE